MFRTQENEVIMQLTFSKSDPRNIMEYSVETIELTKILLSHGKFRNCEPVKMNRPKPELILRAIELANYSTKPHHKSKRWTRPLGLPV